MLPPNFITIRSRDRISGTPSDFYVQFRGDVNYLRGVSSMRLVNVVMPVSSYNVTSGLNTITTQVFGGPVTTVTIAPGFYTIDTLCSTIQSYLNTNDATNGWTCSRDPITYKVTFTSNQLNYNVDLTNLYRELGFSAGINHTGTGTLTSPNIPFFGLTNIFIKLPEVPLVKNSTSNGVHYHFGIPVQVNAGEIINATKNDIVPDRAIPCLPPTDIYQLRVVVLAETATASTPTVLDLNNIDWAMTLEVTYV
jgi:hypothetical protein